MRTLLLVGYLATWGFIPHLLLLKKRPAATLAWLWAILFIPFAGALVYCLFGTDRLKRRRLKHRARFSARPSRQPAPTSATDEATAALIRNQALANLKAAIEDSRGPLPVEPEVHAETVVEDVSPDSSSVTDVIAEARPRSIRELQEAIAQHRNFAGQEMADHLTTLYEDI